MKKLTRTSNFLLNLGLAVLIWGVIFALISLGVVSNYIKGIIISVGINVILATSLNVSCGYLGQLPLGHAGFMAVGAYAGAIFIKTTPAAELIKAGNMAGCIIYIAGAVLVSALVAGIFGLIIGIPSLKLKGDYLAIITLGFGEIIRIVITNIDSVLGFKFTYGSYGLQRIPKFSTFTVVYLCTVLCITLIHMFMKSRHGRAVLSIKGNEIAAESVGINTTFYKTTAFVFSAMLAGVAGCLYAGYIGSLYPSGFQFMKSIEILVMVVLGGMGSMIGSIVSATVLTVLPELLRAFSDYRMVAYSLALILMMIFRPQGLFGSYDFSLKALVEKVLNRRNKKEGSDE